MRLDAGLQAACVAGVPKPPKIPNAYLAECGRKGGQSRSAAKVAAGRVNIAKAQAARRKPFGKAIGGTFTLTENGKTLKQLPHDTTEAEIQKAVQSLKT